MTTLYRDVAARIAALAHTVTGGKAAADAAVRGYKQGVCCEVDQDTYGADFEIVIVNDVQEACFITEAHLSTDLGQTKHATNSVDITLYKDDGAGGAAVALATAYNGTATDLTAKQRYAFTGVTNTVEIAAGSRIYALVETNGGTPVTMGMCTIEVDLMKA